MNVTKGKRKIRRTKDKMFEGCIQCGKERVTAYWDYELECYITLAEPQTPCQSCLYIPALEVA